MRRRIIPDVYVWPLIMIGLIFACWGYGWWPVSPQSAVSGAVMGYVLTFLIGLLFDYINRHDTTNSYSAIGFGDIKFIATGGVWLGIEYLGIGLVLSCILGMIWGLWHKQRYIPFGTFFSIGIIWSLIQMFFLI